MRTHSHTTSTNANSFHRVEVITGVGRRRRWSLEDKARIVAESLDPATTSSAVARRYGLHASQLFTWRQQLQRIRCPGVVSDGLRVLPFAIWAAWLECFALCFRLPQLLQTSPYRLLAALTGTCSRN